MTNKKTVKTKRTKTGLARAAAFKIGAHIAENWEAIERERPSYDDYAQRMAKSFSVTCTPSHIQGIVRDIGKTWPNRKLAQTGPTGDSALLARVETLEQQVQLLMSRAYGAAVVPTGPARNGYVQNGHHG